MKLTRKEAEALGIDLPRRRTGKQAAWNGKSEEVEDKSLYAGDKVMDLLCRAHGLPIPDPEVEFALPRKWRLDFVWEGWLALEIQGGIFIAGRHTRGAALLDEYEKLNEAVIRGYSILFCTPQQVKDGSIFPIIKRALGAEGDQS